MDQSDVDSISVGPIDHIRRTQLAYLFRELAEKLDVDNDLENAYTYYCLALKIRPDWKDSLKNKFSSVLCNVGQILEHEGNLEELFSYYESALVYYPESELILNNLGAHLCRLSYPEEALCYFKKAWNINNNYLPAYLNIQATNSLLVERWHFRMLNDSTRNKSYNDAIIKKVQGGCKSVLDIGSGTGILSIYAKKAGAERIYGCDYSKTMNSISNNILKSNGLDDVTIINKLSTELSVPEDIQERMSLVVTETFDGGLLGEHILQTLIHAWENLLEPQSPGKTERVIPKGANLYIAPIECLQIARRNVIIKSNRTERSSFSAGLNLSTLNLSSKYDEPYDTENLKNVNCSYLSPAEKVFEFNFNNVEEMKKFFNGEISNDIILNCNKNGYVDAYAVWFDLILDDEITITSSPYNRTSCWEQAIFPKGKEFYITESTRISLQASCEGGMLSIATEGNSINANNERTFISQPIIACLNCETLLLSHISMFNEIKRIFPRQSISVLDLSTFPYISSLIAQEEGNEIFISNVKANLVIEIKEILASLNVNVPDSNYLDWSEGSKLIKEGAKEFDIIVLDIFETSGQLNEEMIGMVPLLRGLLSPSGLFIPSKVEICCKLVFSEELLNSSEVKPSDDLNIAEYINEYKVSHMIDFNFNEIEYTPMSKDFIICCLDMRELENEYLFKKEVDIVRSGRANALIYWYNCISLETYEFSTAVPDSPINHAATLFDAPIELEENSKVAITFQYNCGGVRFIIEK